MCKFCLSIVKEYSVHDVTLIGSDISNIDLNDYDVIHVHQVPRPEFLNTDAKIIYNIHNFALDCPSGGNVCRILNKHLKNPLTCIDCLGRIGIETGTYNMKKNIKMAQRADIIAVHSEYMKEYYHIYDPVVLPLPLQTDKLVVCRDKEEYLLYTGRLSFEKNPWGFVDIINKTGLKGKMILYTLAEDIASTETHYKDLIKTINKHPDIELILNPSIDYMISLVQHAKFTVLPYLFEEPYGISAANSILCGTPLITFPYGNLRSFTNLLPKTREEMVYIIKQSKNNYDYILKTTIENSNKLKEIHNPINAIKIWDLVYSNVIK